MVKLVFDILDRGEWRTAEVSMVRRPDYQIITLNTDPAVSHEPIVFDFWKSPDGNRVEVVIRRESLFGTIEMPDSKKLLAMLGTP
jgi:hypothetical protein